jgi:hypothetical protein
MSSTLQIAGAVAVVAGVTLISIPFGLIVGGAVLVLLGLALGR